MILLISISAFGAGYFQDGVNREADELRSQINELENQMDRIEIRIQGVRLSDKAYENQAEEFLNDAILYDRTINALNDSFTPEERILHYDMLAARVWDFRGALRGIEIVNIYWWFQFETVDWVIASEELDGFNYTISKAFWDSYQDDYPNLVINLTYTEAFHTVADYTKGGFIHAAAYYDYAILPEWFMIPTYASSSIYDNFFYQTLYDLQAEIITLEDNLIALERKSDYYVYGLSLITVAAILASAMSNRMADKEVDSQFGDVLAKLHENENLKTSPWDNFAFAVLILAGLIAILGILLPILL